MSGDYIKSYNEWPPPCSITDDISIHFEDRLKKLNSEHGKVQLGNITVDMVLGGMRRMIGMLWETSLLEPEVNTTKIVLKLQCQSCKYYSQNPIKVLRAEKEAPEKIASSSDRTFVLRCLQYY